VILPKQNEADLSDIPKPLRQNMTFHFVEHLDQVLDLALVGGLKALEHRAREAKAKGSRARSKKEVVAHA
jgi:ATP-dependent Lon protease